MTNSRLQVTRDRYGIPSKIEYNGEELNIIVNEVKAEAIPFNHSVWLRVDVKEYLDIYEEEDE
jgi:hypothetical protein